MQKKMRPSVVAALWAALLMTLSGCGQKGPLTLPPAAPAASAPAAPAALTPVPR